MITIFAWIYFNSASEFRIVGFEAKDPRLIMKNTVLTAAFSGITFFFLCIFEKKSKVGRMSIVDPVPFFNSMFAGLAASSASCGYVDTLGAAIVGIFAGWIYSLSGKLIKKFEVDDPLEVS